MKAILTSACVLYVYTFRFAQGVPNQPKTEKENGNQEESLFFVVVNDDSTWRIDCTSNVPR